MLSVHGILVSLGCCDTVLGGLNNKCLFLIVPQAASPRSEGQHGGALSECPLPGLQIAVFISSHDRKRKRMRERDRDRERDREKEAERTSYLSLF